MGNSKSAVGSMGLLQKMKIFDRLMLLTVAELCMFEGCSVLYFSVVSDDITLTFVCFVKDLRN